MEKVRLVEDTLVEGLFGHIVIGNVFWSQFGQYLDQYLCVAEKEICAKIDQVLLHHDLNKFPVSGPHLKNVLVWLKNCYSNHGKQLSSEAMSLLEAVTKRPEPVFIYKTLNRNPGLNPLRGNVTLMEENDIIGHGTTGLTSWQGALFLTDWLLANGQTLLQDKRIIELGCGPGFLGLHLLSNFNISQYIFTDGHPEVLKAVKFNLQLNNGGFDHLSYKDFEEFAHQGYPQINTVHHKWRPTDCESEALVEKLNWLEPVIDKSWQGIQIILGADIVYERSLIPPLCQVLVVLLKQNSQNQCKALISCTERSATTLNCFETSLTDVNLKFSVVGRGFFTPAESLLCSDVLHQATRIYEIQL